MIALADNDCENAKKEYISKSENMQFAWDGKKTGNQEPGTRNFELLSKCSNDFKKNSQ